MRCAHVKRLNPIRSLGHINAHINPITLFGVHVNTTFGFDNQNELIRMEAKSVHVNVATDTLHKEGKPQTFIAKEAGCLKSAVSKHVNRKLSGRKKCGRKICTTNRENHSLMRIVKQNRFRNLGELHKEWTEAGVKASRATTHRRVKEFGYSCRIPLVKPLLNHRQRQRRLTWAKEKKSWTVAQWSKVLFSDESKFCISFENQDPRVWRSS